MSTWGTGGLITTETVVSFATILVWESEEARALRRSEYLYLVQQAPQGRSQQEEWTPIKYYTDASEAIEHARTLSTPSAPARVVKLTP